MGTYNATSETVKRDWYVIDATNKTLGRLASFVASRLKGKHKPEFTPHVDTGDYIIITNAEKIRVTGKKMTDKLYTRHSGYPGGLKQQPLSKLLATFPERVLETAIRGMLPKGPLGRQMFRKLRVYQGGEHEHTSQQPEVLEFTETE